MSCKWMRYSINRATFSSFAVKALLIKKLVVFEGSVRILCVSGNILFYIKRRK